MLKLSKTITDLPVMSLRTGGRVAHAHEPIINPSDLKIEGWYCTDAFSKQKLILLAQDVRDFVPQGIAVDDHESLSDPDDLIRLKEVIELDFSILGKPVITNHKRRLGKVSDFALDPLTMKIQKLYVNRPVYRSITDGQLSIDRSQIIEITNRRVVIRDADVKVKTESRVPSTAPLTS